MNYDLIVIGSGFTGSTVAYLAANTLNLRVLLLEKRKHVSGNMYDEVDQETGILVQKYGPHTFHTNSDKVFGFVTAIGTWKPYTLKVGSMIKGICTPMPFNFETIDTFFTIKEADEIKTALVCEYNYKKKVTIVELLNHNNPIIRSYGLFLFENDYKPYSAKQWGIDPEKLDISILKRVPVRLSYIDQYFDDMYEMQPTNGYTEFFKKMLDNSNINICLDCDALNFLSIDTNKGKLKYNQENVTIPVVYTGEIDRLLSYKYGELPYRSLSFEYSTLNTTSFQSRQGIAYPFADGFTRITEFTKLPIQYGRGKTIIAKEFPMPYSKELKNEPYYPVLTAESKKQYEKYRTEIQKIKNLYVCGRLGDFKYYNMDDAILRGFEVIHDIFGKNV